MSLLLRGCVLVAIALTIALGLSPLRSVTEASVARALSLAELVDRADHVVVAMAGAHKARWHRNGKWIVTDHTLHVERSMKGTAKAGQVLIATVLGGTLDGVGLQVPGAASFRQHGRAIVFLRESLPSGDLRVVGMSQGVLVLRDGDRGASPVMVAPGGHGAVLMDDDGSGALQPASSALLAPRPADEVLAEIEALVDKRVDNRGAAGDGASQKK